MMNQNSLRNIIGIIGNVISFGLFISPAPTFYQIFKRKAVEDFSPNPYLATILNCAMWVYYGCPFVHNGILVVTINAFGFALEIGYVLFYLYYANDKRKRMYVAKILVAEAVFFIIVVALTMKLLSSHDSRALVVGILCVIFNICMYAMPLDVMKLVIKTKSVEYMPFYLLCANFLNGLIWLTYAQLVKFDLFITISNGSGAALGLAQLLLYAIYYKSTPKKSVSRDTEMQPPNIV